MKAEKQRCRVCGCTDEHACPSGCRWVRWNLCSACAVPTSGAGRWKTAFDRYYLVFECRTPNARTSYIAVRANNAREALDPVPDDTFRSLGAVLAHSKRDAILAALAGQTQRMADALKADRPGGAS